MAKIKKEQLIAFASIGGKACLKKHGKDFYKKIAEARWKKHREKKVLEKK